jgi:RNA polymerase sigma-70 factor (ECF subfamily)
MKAITDDISLLANIQSQDAEAFKQLFDEHWELLFKLAVQKTGREQDAEDIVQDLFIDLWNKKTPITLTTSLKTYLVSCIYLKIFQYYRKQGFQKKQHDDFSEFVAQSLSGHSIAHLNASELETEYGKMQDIISQTVALMPTQMRTVFSLKHYQGLTTNAIAAQLNISPESVKTHLKLGMKRMRKTAVQYPASTLLPAFIAILECSY